MAQWYRQALAKALNKEIDWDSDTQKCALATSSYTPNLDTHTHFSDVTGEVTGTGYTAGGNTLTSCAVTYTAANSWSATWAASTAFTVDQIVRPSSANGYVYRCAVAGTSGGSAPSFPTVVGMTVTDGGVTWVCVGSGMLVLSGTIPSWTSSTFTARYGIVYDAATGTASTEPLIGLIDFGSDKSTSSGTFAITESSGVMALALP